MMLLGFQAEILGGINQLGEVLDAAGGPLADFAIVVHDTANAGARLALWVDLLLFGVVVEVVVHAEVVAKLVSNGLLLI